METLFTIGFERFSIEEFISVLKDNNINLLVDVRSKPHSDRFPAYNRDALKTTLAEHEISHESYAREFGARQKNPNYYTNGVMDFDLFRRSAVFTEGVDKLCKRIQSGEIVALMCHENDPMDCHRAILCSRAFFERGFHVIHLIAGQPAITQETIQSRLIKKFFSGQFYLGNKNLISHAYREQNKRIGYRK